MAPNLSGALLMMASMAAFTFNDACIKLTGGAVPLFQLLFLRGVLTTLLVYGLARYLGTIHLGISRRDWGVIALRSAAEIGAAYFFLTALFNMPLANVTAILQVLPLTVTLGSALFFREAVGWRRTLAIVVGFAGMLLIVRPGPEGFNLFALYALIAVVCVTIRDLTTRRLSPGVPSLTVTLAASLSITVVSGVYRWVVIGSPSHRSRAGSSRALRFSYWGAICSAFWSCAWVTCRLLPHFDIPVWFGHCFWDGSCLGTGRMVKPCWAPELLSRRVCLRSIGNGRP